MDCDHYCEDFIRVYDKALSREFCRGIIDYFEWCVENNRVWDRKIDSNKLRKDDLSTTMNPTNFYDIQFTKEHLHGYINEFNNAFWDECYNSYCDEFDVINSLGKHTVFSYKVQKTMPAQGYHVWHSEASDRELSNRIMAYILYLNDVPDGGETEFLYQRKRIDPKEGRLVLFPACYTHIHRGNPPLRGSKYIMTGWIEFG